MIGLIVIGKVDCLTGISVRESVVIFRGIGGSNIMDIQFLIFVHSKDSGHIRTYRSIHDLQADLEKIDIENGEYDFWDRTGSPMAVNIQPPVWISVTPLLSEAPPSGTLLECVREFVNRVGLADAKRLTIENAEELVTMANGVLKKRQLENSLLARFFSRFRRSKQL